MKFSIVAIAYNNPQLVNLLITSIFLLDYPREEYEVIVVDDGSTPSLQSMLDVSSEAIQFIYLPRCEQSSRSRARNSGAAIAKGKLIVFIDSDCVVRNNFLQSYEQTFIEKPGLSAVLGGLQYVDHNAVPAPLSTEALDQLAQTDMYNRHDYRYRLLALNNNSIENISANWLLFLSGNFCIKKCVFFDVGQFEERFLKWGSEDSELGYRLAKKGYTYELTSNKVFHISDHSAEGISIDRYNSWLHNVGLFYHIHQDPVILLMMLQEKMIFDRFCLNEPWQKEFQISSFQAIKARISIIANKT